MNRVSPFRKRCWTNSNMVRRLGSTEEGPHDYAYTVSLAVHASIRQPG